MKNNKKLIYIWLGVGLILWPLVWAALTNGSAPPNRAIVISSVVSGCVLIASTYRRSIGKNGALETSIIAPVVMFAFFIIASTIVYYITGLALYAQLSN